MGTFQIKIGVYAYILDLMILVNAPTIIKIKNGETTIQVTYQKCVQKQPLNVLGTHTGLIGGTVPIPTLMIIINVSPIIKIKPGETVIQLYCYICALFQDLNVLVTNQELIPKI